MHNPYVEIGLLYVREAVLRTIVMVLGLLTLTICYLVLYDRSASHVLAGQLLTCSAGIAVPAVIFWQTLRKQLLSECRLLWPNYAWRHIEFFAVISAIFLMGCGAVATLERANGPGILALSCAAFAIIGWRGVKDRAVLDALVFGGWIGTAFMNASAIDAFAQRIALPASVAIIVVSSLLSAAAVWRMSSISGEELDSTLAERARNSAFISSGKRSLLRAARQPFIAPDKSLWSRVRQWRSLNSSKRGYELFDYLSLCMLVTWLCPPFRGVPVTLLAFLGGFPAMAVDTRWRNLFPCLQADFLRPINRRQMIREIGLAIALNVAQIAVVGDCSWWLMVRLTHGWPGGWALLYQTATLVGFQVFWFGYFVWMLRFESRRWVLVYALAIAMILWLAMRSFHALSPWALCGLVAAGGILVWDAYRRWLVTELG